MTTTGGRPGTGEGAPDALVVWTLGHSSRPLETILSLLRGAGIEQVADVRRYPGSRAHPHYNPGPFATALGEAGIRYLPFPELGGRRAPDAASTNTVWRNPAFRGYADYMASAEFRSGLTRLVRAADEARTAILCSEAVWWRCHRSLIADALKAAGIRVLHIMDAGKLTEHPFTAAARVVDGQLRYGAASS